MHGPSQGQVHPQVRPAGRLQLPADPDRVRARPGRHVRRLLHIRAHIHEAPLQEVSVNGQVNPTPVIFST